MSDSNFQDLQSRLSKAEESAKSAHKRIDELHEVTRAFYELASDVKVMVNEMSRMKTDITDIKKKVDAHDDEPSKLMFNIKNTIVTGIVAALVGAIIALILK